MSATYNYHENCFLVWECHCWLLERLCTVCCGGWCFLTRYTDTLQEENAATWYVWRNDETNKLCKVLDDWTTNNLQQYIITILLQFLQHGYRKREQAAAYQQELEAAVSDTHDTSQALTQEDFSEKHTQVLTRTKFKVHTGSNIRLASPQ